MQNAHRYAACAPIRGLLLVALCTTGCPESDPRFDFDGDGSLDSEDCEPENDQIYPEADDPYGDGIDQDCDGYDGIDRDGDGYPANDDLDDEYLHLYDCNDNDASIHPYAEEEPNDDIDQDCNDEDCVDLDHDTYCLGAEDCDDDDPDVYLGHEEVPDSKDNNCNDDVDEGTDAYDDDGDGACEGYDLNSDGNDQCTDVDDVPGDCDDEDPSLNVQDNDEDGWDTCEGDCDDADDDRYPSNPEICDGKDNDCDGDLGPAEHDEDGDQWMACEGDCDDDDGDVNPEDTDGDGYSPCDSPPDCDDTNPLLTPVDFDHDGISSCDGDCDDGDALIFPGAPETCDGMDDDCDGSLAPTEYDMDLDGWMECEGDCDDADPALNPGDGDGDGYSPCDDDCDDTDPELTPLDEDYDGFTPCTGDCDEGDYWVNPSAVEECDLVDNDCDGSHAPFDETDADGDYDPACSDCDDGDASLSGFDLDGDGFSTCQGDCDDSMASINPFAQDNVGDAIDQNCDDVDGTDQDRDGYASEQSGGTDCDDGDPAMNQSDSDADGWSTCAGDCDDSDSFLNLTDGDGDGWDTCDGDCDDSDAAMHLDDADSDGWSSCAGDCDDSRSSTYPGAAEQCDGRDNDCDPSTDELVDGDGDGYTICGGDCDDTDPGLDPGDADQDGYSSCDGDCDDADISLSPGGIEVCDTLDNDCDGPADEDCVQCNLWVPTDANSINEAILASSHGDVVCVDQGTYTENVDFQGMAIRLLAPAGPGTTIIDGDGIDSVVRFDNQESADSILQGFTITGGRAEYGGGLFLDDSSPTLLNLVIRSNEATSEIKAAGGGIYMSEASPTLRQVSVLDNLAAASVYHSSSYGGGIYMEYSSPLIQSMEVSGNVARTTDSDDSLAGGGIYVTGGYPRLLEVTISDNELYSLSPCQGCSGYGAGLDAIYSAVELVDVVVDGNGSEGYQYSALSVGEGSYLQDVIVRDNISGGLVVGGTAVLRNIEIDGNSNYSEGNLCLYGLGHPTLDNVVVSDNSSVYLVGGVYINTSASLSNILITGNVCLSESDCTGGIRITDYYGDETVEIENALILGNESRAGSDYTTSAGGMVLAGSSATITNATIAGNITDYVGGGVTLVGGSTPTFTNVAIIDNEAAFFGGGVYAVANQQNLLSTNYGNIHGNVPNEVHGFPDPVGYGGNISQDPVFLDVGGADPKFWDLHLSGTSPQIDGGDPAILDPEGTRSDIGAFGGPGADLWDSDLDGYFDWWQPGPYELGYVIDGLDCDDRDSTISPSTDEICDGLDNDCDGVIDGVDQDGDGYFDHHCGGDDCDDEDENTYPGASEWMDSSDNDCNGWVDDGMDVVDDDGDGYSEADGDCDDNDPARSPDDADADGFPGCGPIGDCDDDDASLSPSDGDLDGFSSCDGDCDDADPLISPQAGELEDGVDNDCNGTEDDGTDLFDDDGDGWCEGFDLDQDGSDDCTDGSLPGDCDDDDFLLHPDDHDGDGFAPCDGDCDDDDSSTFPGQWDDPGDGIDWDCDGTDSTGLRFADVAFVGEEQWDYSGHSIASAGDVDGDGLDDILIGALYNDDGGIDAGKAYLIFGATVQGSASIDLSTADATFVCEEEDSLCGSSVSSAGDVDGDGLDDILIGAYGSDAGATQAGKTYLIFGSTVQGGGDYDPQSADAAFEGEDAFDRSGWSVSSAGDVDGDGLDDVLIGAPQAESGGRTYLIFGSTVAAGGNFDLSNADATMVGEAGDCSDYSVSSAGDVDGDGLDDVLIGAGGNDEGGSSAGKTYLMFGSALQGGGSFDLALADAELVGIEGDGSGSSVSSAGDVDGDGLDDILIGAHWNDDAASSAGKTYLMFGSTLQVGGSFDLAYADAAFLGEANYEDYSGNPIASAGDVDGDGLDDLLIGAYGNDEGGSYAGKTYLMFGSTVQGGGSFDLTYADAAFVGVSGDYSSISVSSAGDVSGDGLDDILIGAYQNDDGGGSAGKTYLAFSPY